MSYYLQCLFFCLDSFPIMRGFCQQKNREEPHGKATVVVYQGDHIWKKMLYQNVNDIDSIFYAFLLCEYEFMFSNL